MSVHFTNDPKKFTPQPSPSVSSVGEDESYRVTTDSSGRDNGTTFRQQNGGSKLRRVESRVPLEHLPEEKPFLQATQKWWRKRRRFPSCSTPGTRGEREELQGLQGLQGLQEGGEGARYFLLSVCTCVQ